MFANVHSESGYDLFVHTCRVTLQKLASELVISLFVNQKKDISDGDTGRTAVVRTMFPHAPEIAQLT